MFRVTNTGGFHSKWYISNGGHEYLHSDGSVIPDCVEYWPTQEQAQAVLDKYQPKHVWEHGDVFKIGKCTMVYLNTWPEPKVIHLNTDCSQIVWWNLPGYLDDAEFLFNIKEKL